MLIGPAVTTPMVLTPTAIRPIPTMAALSTPIATTPMETTPMGTTPMEITPIGTMPTATVPIGATPIARCLRGVLQCSLVGINSVVALMTRLIVLGTHHPHGAHTVSPLAAETRRCRFSFLLGFEHRLLRLTAMGIRQGRAGDHHQGGAKQQQGALHQMVNQDASLCR